MFARNVRRELIDYQDRLARWRHAVPPSARRFHASLEQLSRQIRRLLSRWWQPWIGADELERIRGQVRRLEPLAKDLETLIRAAEKLTDKAQRFVEWTSEMPDTELAAWLETRAREWLIRTGRIGTHCDRPPELFHDQQILADTEAELRLYSEAAERLVEAHGILEKLDADSQAAGLEAALADLRQRFYRDGATVQWLDALEEQVAALRKRADRLRDLPPVLQKVASLISDLRGWSRQLGELDAEVLELKHHQERLAAFERTTEDPAELDRAVDQAQSLHDELLSRARGARHRRLEQLRQHLDDLSRACGRQPGLEEVLQDLEHRHRRVTRHHQHGSWLKRFDHAYDVQLRGTAKANRKLLEARLSNRVGKLRERLEQMRRRPLSSPARRQTEELDHDVSALAHARDAEGILGNLRRIPGLEHDLADLDREARQDLSELATLQAKLSGRHAELRIEAARAGLDLPDLGDDIEILCTGFEKLDEARHAAHQLADKLDDLDRQVVERRQLEAEHRGDLDRVHFTITAPRTVAAGTYFLLDLWAHLETQRHEVLARARQAADRRDLQIRTKGPVLVVRGTLLTARLRIDGLKVEDPRDVILWEGEIGTAGFVVSVPRDTAQGTRSGLMTIHVDGLQIARLHFLILIGPAVSDVDSVPMQESVHRKAFASYSSADRREVLGRVQGMQKAVPQLDVFVDVLALRSGDYWEQEIRQRIPENDVFYLFWSANARASQCVEKEWRCALETRGLEFIEPVPLVPPQVVPPPPELAARHFNDWVLAFMGDEA